MDYFSRVSIAVIKKYHDKKQCGEERVYVAYISWTTVHWGKSEHALKLGRTWRLELMQRPWRNAVYYWLAPHGLLSLLSYRTQVHQPRDGTPHQSLIKKMPSSWILQRQFLNRGSLLSDNSSLCQVDIKLARIVVGSTRPQWKDFSVSASVCLSDNVLGNLDCVPKHNSEFSSEQTIFFGSLKTTCWLRIKLKC